MGDMEKREEFLDDIKETYAEMREEFFAGLEDRKYLPLVKARESVTLPDFTSAEHKPVKPKFLGTKTLKDVPIGDVIPYIDWNPFFQVWQLRGRYPNRGYPKIFNDENVGKEAKKLHDDALKMLDEIVANKTLQAKGVVGI